MSPDLVWYSQEARSYSLYVAVAAGSVLLCVRAVAAPSRSRLAGWSLCAALALATHYFASFLIGAELVWLALAVRPWRLVAIAAVGPLLMGLLLLPLALKQMASGGAGYFGDIPLGERLSQVGHEYLAGPPAPADATASIVGLAMAIAVALWGLLRPGAGRERRAAGIIALVAACAFAVPVLLDVAGSHIFNERNAMGVIPLVAVAIGCGLARLSRVQLGAELGGCLLAVALAAFPAGRSAPGLAGGGRAVGSRRSDPGVHHRAPNQQSPPGSGRRRTGRRRPAAHRRRARQGSAGVRTGRDQYSRRPLLRRRPHAHFDPRADTRLSLHRCPAAWQCGGLPLPCAATDRCLGAGAVRQRHPARQARRHVELAEQRGRALCPAGSAGGAPVASAYSCRDRQPRSERNHAAPPAARGGGLVAEPARG